MTPVVDHPAALTMRRAALPAVASIGLLLAACGSAERPQAATPAAQPAARADAFPVTIDHKFGSTLIPRQAMRVLSLGYQEHDTIFALGVTPIAVRYWFGSETDVIFPWAEEKAAGAQPPILKMPYGELNFEKISALKPDLILGVYSGITAKEYETLSRIAPTVAQTADFVDFGNPWQDTTRVLGRALGRSELAEKLVADLEAQFASARDRNPNWQGRTVAVATYRSKGGTFGFFASQDPRARFFTSLGFTVPRSLDEAAAGKFFGQVSAERLSLFDTDLLVWDQLQYAGGRATVEADPLVGQLKAMSERRAIYMEGDLENAFAFNSVLSLPFVLDKVIPMIESAAKGWSR